MPGTPLIEAMSKAEPLYQIPEDDLVGEVLIPAMAVADEARIGAGFFSSRCLAQIAPGLAEFLANPDRQLSLLISPEISEEDRDALERGTRSPEQVIREAEQRLFTDASLSASGLVQHTLDCLAYLIAAGRLTVRFALMARGQYHKKKWLLRGGSDWLAVHGSGNATARGLLVNGEQMTVDRPWADGSAAATRVAKLVRGWERDWNNENPHVLAIDVTDGLRVIRKHGAKQAVPTIDDFWRAWQADHMRGLEPALPPGVTTQPSRLLRVPEGVEWETGLYAHQGVAVRTFLEAGSRGILAIATGGGKTQTSLIAAVSRAGPPSRPDALDDHRADCAADAPVDRGHPPLRDRAGSSGQPHHPEAPRLDRGTQGKPAPRSRITQPSSCVPSSCSPATRTCVRRSKAAAAGADHAHRRRGTQSGCARRSSGWHPLVSTYGSGCRRRLHASTTPTEARSCSTSSARRSTTSLSLTRSASAASRPTVLPA